MTWQPKIGNTNFGLKMVSELPTSGIIQNLGSIDMGNSKSQIDQEEELEEEIMVETNISKLLSERTTKVVIIIVLIMLFFQPIFSSDTYSNEPTQTDQALLFIADIYDKNASWPLYQNAV